MGAARMKTPEPFNLPARLSIAALVVLGLLGGSLIVAHAGFETSPRRGGPSTFVPAPEAYILAAIMYLLSAVAMLALLRDRRCSMPAIGGAFLAYPAIAGALVAVLAPS
jgi:hypothetical protein